jgi:hypothetical protein
MAPGKLAVIGNVADRVQLSCSGIYGLDELQIEVYCSDKVQRAGVRRMLEDALWPVEWMAGFRLVLPQYHNAIATFLPLSAQLGDSIETAMAGLRPLTFPAPRPVPDVPRASAAARQAADRRRHEVGLVVVRGSGAR